MENNLKIGDYLYKVIYWEGFRKSKREIRKVKIKKINPKSYGIIYCGWTINKSEVGESWFPTLREALLKALERHEEELEAIDENKKTFEKECKYLKKKLKELDANAKGDEGR